MLSVDELLSYYLGNEEAYKALATEYMKYNSSMSGDNLDEVDIQKIYEDLPIHADSIIGKYISWSYT